MRLHLPRRLTFPCPSAPVVKLSCYRFLGYGALLELDGFSVLAVEETPAGNLQREAIDSFNADCTVRTRAAT